MKQLAFYKTALLHRCALPTWMSLSLILALLFSLSAAPAQSALAASARFQESPSAASTIYLPIIFKNYPRTNIFGVTMDMVTDAYGLTPIANAGTTWTRRPISWSAIEPTQGARNWAAFPEQEMIDAASRGIRVILVVESTPGWALKSGFSCGAVGQQKFTALGNFLYDLVKRYSAAPYNIRYWELWNEPDAKGLLGCWGDSSDPQYYGGSYYGTMLKTVAGRIKAADPAAQVLVGGLLLACDPIHPLLGRDCTSSRFLNGILAAGGGPFFEGVSFHAYDYFDTGSDLYSNADWNSSASTTGPVAIAKADYLRGVLAQYGYSNKYLINTETALFHGPNVMTPVCMANPPADLASANAYYLVQAYSVAIAEGFAGSVWYSSFGVRCSGLFDTNLNPKPAFNAYSYMASKLGEATFSRQIDTFLGVMGYEYKLPDRRIWVLWSTGKTSSHTISLPSLPTAITVIGPDGSPQFEAVSTNTVITVAPRFIEFAP